MKRILTRSARVTRAVRLVNGASDAEPVHVHHNHNTTTLTTKSAAVSGSNSPEGFSAVTPPSSYSR